MSGVVLQFMRPCKALSALGSYVLDASSERSLQFYYKVMVLADSTVQTDPLPGCPRPSKLSVNGPQPLHRQSTSARARFRKREQHRRFRAKRPTQSFMDLALGRRRCSTRFRRNRRLVRLCVARRIGRRAARQHLVSSGLRHHRAR